MNGEIRIPVAKGNIRRFDDPNTPGLFSYHALVPVLELPDLPLDVNPRAQNPSSLVSKKIREGLEQHYETFHLLNRGITIIASDAESDNRQDSLVLRFPSRTEYYDTDEGVLPEVVPEGKEDEYEMDRYLKNYGYGIVDGGHTFRVIREAVERASKDNELRERLARACVHLEVLVNVSDLSEELARARNTSAQVKELSLMNLGRKFDWLKNELRDEQYADKIMWRENEPNKPINATLIIQLLTALHPSHLHASDRPPMIAYRGAGQCITRFKDEETIFETTHTPNGFRQLRPIVRDILRLYDHIRDTMAEHYVAFGGLRRIRLDRDPNTEINGEKDRRIRGRARAVISEFDVNDRHPHEMYFISKQNPVVPHQGLVMPVLSGFRALVGIRKDTKLAYWRADPRKIYDQNGQNYVRAVFETSDGLGRAPNTVGKHGTLWNQLFGFVQMDFIRSTGVLERAIEASTQA